MAAKFRTWAGSKADRKHASSGIVPIPVECITIKGMEYGRKSKGSSRANRKPLPLDFTHTPDTTSAHSSRTQDSIALHDAAVQSATSLMAVMSDMLKSPQLSAHLLSTQQQGGLQPMHGRPRSRTAPPTPMVEAPTMEPVELPGSVPVWPKSHHISQCFDDRTVRSVTIPSSASVEKPIERPHSSPQDMTYRLPIHPRQSSESPSRSTTNLQPPIDCTPRSKSASPYQPNRPTPFNSSSKEIIPLTKDHHSDASTTRRASFQVAPSHHQRSTCISGSIPLSQNGYENSAPLVDATSVQNGSWAVDALPACDSETMWMEQITAIRAAHEAHVVSLREAHDRDVASHRAYISLLEKRRTLSPAPPPNSMGHLTIDTSHSAGRPGGSFGEESSATTSLQSFESSLESHRRASAEAIAETESLRRKLSLARKAQAELGDVRRERDHFKDASERGDKRILQLKDIVRKAKENERALKNMVSSLEASLQAANMERTDVLEGFHEACEQIRKLSNRHISLTKDRDELRHGLDETSKSSTEHSSSIDEPETGTASEKSERKRATLRDDPLLQQIDDLRQLLMEKDARISELEVKCEVEAARSLNAQDRKADLEDRPTLQAQLEVSRLQLEHAKADRDRYDSLLHAELRRQTKVAAQKAHSATPQIEGEASKSVAERLRRMSTLSSASAKDQPHRNEPDSARLAIFEQELKHCIQEIIMYKLDVKGYKKDLKTAHARIEAFEMATASARPQTPDSRTGRSERNRKDITMPEPPPSAGLGISFPSNQAPSTPPNNPISTATTHALLSATPTPVPGATNPSLPNLSPSPRPKTPLGVHNKRLPKPPPRTPSPSPSPRSLPITTSPSRQRAAAGKRHSPSRSQNIQRQETLRSLSESIISSYAKRGASTPEEQPYDIHVLPPLPQPPPASQMPGRGHHSDPPPPRSERLGTGNANSTSDRGESIEGRRSRSENGESAIAVPVLMRKYSSEMLKTLGNGAGGIIPDGGR